MPPPNLRIIKPRPVIIPIQPEIILKCFSIVKASIITSNLSVCLQIKLLVAEHTCGVILGVMQKFPGYHITMSKCIKKIAKLPAQQFCTGSFIN